jgi:FtsZ-binding cell division protein ZapB
MTDTWHRMTDTYRKESQKDRYNNDSQPTMEQVTVDCLQRIADAAEVMSQNHQRLIDERDRYKRRAEHLDTENERLARRISALRGVITRLKRKVHP